MHGLDSDLSSIQRWPQGAIGQPMRSHTHLRQSQWTLHRLWSGGGHVDWWPHAASCFFTLILGGSALYQGRPAGM